MKLSLEACVICDIYDRGINCIPNMLLRFISLLSRLAIVRGQSVRCWASNVPATAQPAPGFTLPLLSHPAQALPYPWKVFLCARSHLSKHTLLQVGSPMHWTVPLCSLGTVYLIWTHTSVETTPTLQLITHLCSDSQWRRIISFEVCIILSVFNVASE